MTCHPHPIYLVELIHPLSGEIEDTDVCAKLSLAVEKVYLHLQDHPAVPVSVEVSYDDEQELEGVGFFDADRNIISCVTVYHLERDTEEPSVPAIDVACRRAGPDLESQLNNIFKS